MGAHFAREWRFCLVKTYTSTTFGVHHAGPVITSHVQKPIWLDIQHISSPSSDPRSLATAPPLMPFFPLCSPEMLLIPQGSFPGLFPKGIMRVKCQVAGTLLTFNKSYSVVALWSLSPCAILTTPVFILLTLFDKPFSPLDPTLGTGPVFYSSLHP